MSKVSKCLCEECHYNESQECKADAIEVHSCGDNIVESSDGTACKTFRKRS